MRTSVILPVCAMPVWAVLLLFAASNSSAEDWPQFRGPTGLGYTEEKDLPIRWGGAEQENVLWKSPLIGEGHASPIVWASPVADANGRLCFATAGVSYVIQTRPEFRVLSINDLGDPNHASPAVSRSKMFLVGTRNVYCVGAK